MFGGEGLGKLGDKMFENSTQPAFILISEAVQ